MFNRVGNWLKTTVLGIIVLSALGSALWAGVLWIFQKSFGIFQDGELLNVSKILPYAAAAFFGFVSTYWMVKKFVARENPATAPVPQGQPDHAPVDSSFNERRKGMNILDARKKLTIYEAAAMAVGIDPELYKNAWMRGGPTTDRDGLPQNVIDQFQFMSS